MIKLEIRQQNRELIKRYKTKCHFCGESETCCLEFHHFKPKKFGISQGITTKTTEELEQELQKCYCVCKNCHAKLHNGLIQ